MNTNNFALDDFYKLDLMNKVASQKAEIPDKLGNYFKRKYSDSLFKHFETNIKQQLKEKNEMIETDDNQELDKLKLDFNTALEGIDEIAD